MLGIPGVLVRAPSVACIAVDADGDGEFVGTRTPQVLQMNVRSFWNSSTLEELLAPRH